MIIQGKVVGGVLCGGAYPAVNEMLHPDKVLFDAGFDKAVVLSTTPTVYLAYRSYVTWDGVTKTTVEVPDPENPEGPPLSTYDVPVYDDTADPEIADNAYFIVGAAVPAVVQIRPEWLDTPDEKPMGDKPADALDDGEITGWPEPGRRYYPFGWIISVD